MIEHAEFRNFKALRDVRIDLERFTVLVGPNASGKTSVLEGLYWMAQCHPSESFPGFSGGKTPDVLRTRNTSGEIGFSIEGESLHRNVRAYLVSDDPDSFDARCEQVSAEQPGFAWRISRMWKNTNFGTDWTFLDDSPASSIRWGAVSASYLRPG